MVLKVKLTRYWESFKTNFWFLPLLIISGAILLAIGLIYLDFWLDIPEWEYIYIFSTGGAAGARTILSTIAGSMMTVAGIVFSITLVALTLASSQFGPRLLRNYMKNRLNQTVLGTYVATFLYCLIILGAVNQEMGENFIPQLSVLVAIIAAVANIFLLIIFIHQIATSIQAEYVISEVSSELNESLRNFFPEEGPAEKYDVEELEKRALQRKNMYAKNESLHMWRSGYLQALDQDELIKIADKYDLLIEYDYRPGGFAIEGIRLVNIYYNDEFQEVILDEIRSCFIFGKQRSPSQDPEYAIHQLVEIASRALSPGINDPYTAMSCSDKLGAAVGFLLSRKFPSRYLLDEDKNIRVISNPIVFKGVAAAAFNQIRQYGKGNPSVLIHLLDVMLSLAELVKNEEQENVIRQHSDMIMRSGTESFTEPKDLEDLDRRHEKIKSLLQGNRDSKISAMDLD